MQLEGVIIIRSDIRQNDNQERAAGKSLPEEIIGLQALVSPKTVTSLPENSDFWVQKKVLSGEKVLMFVEKDAYLLENKSASDGKWVCM